MEEDRLDPLGTFHVEAHGVMVGVVGEIVDEEITDRFMNIGGGMMMNETNNSLMTIVGE